MQIKEAIKRVCAEQLDKAYEKQLMVRKVDYHQWILAKENAETFTEETAEDFVILHQKRGTLSNKVKEYLTQYFTRYPEAKLLYGDEDLQGIDGKRSNPWYKPAWSPDTYLSQFYLGSVIAVRKSVWQEVISAKETLVFEKPDEVRPIVTKLLEHIGGFEKNCQSIKRVPQILFHVSHEKVWQEYLACKDKKTKEADTEGMVSIIIPSKDNPQVLKQCLDALRGLENIEIIVVDNGSSDENRQQIEAFMKNNTYLYRPMQFNFSDMCNMGVQASKGKYLLFLNDDVEVQGKTWLTKMKQKAAKCYVGAVGLKLYYPQSKKLQHAGITNVDVGPVHKLQFAEDEGEYYFGRNRGTWNCLAVTGACLLIEKQKYQEAGGFKNDLQVAYNDVELCFALYEAGYQNVVLLDEYAYHYESLSRGDDVAGEKFKRLMKERELLYQLHPALQFQDLYYPKELNSTGLDSNIVPAYVSAGNVLQEAKIRSCPFSLSELREDKCFIMGVGQNEQGHINGYGVVLGDDNACYDRYLLFTKDREDLGQAYVVKTNRQYRQDLEVNIPDQKNVALSGFEIKLPEGKDALSEEYEIGVIAVHKLSKLKLLCFSGRHLRG